MSDYSSVVDAIISDLKNNVPRLVEVEDANTHRYSPWAPEELTADGKAHLAVWPASDAEQAEPLDTDGHMLKQTYRVLYWESAGTEGVRLVSDEAGAAALLDLHNAVRARFYVATNQTLGGSALVWYQATSFPEQVSRVRGFEISLRVDRTIHFT